MSRYLIAVLPFALAVLAPVVAAIAPAPQPLTISSEPDPGFVQALKARSAPRARADGVLG